MTAAEINRILTELEDRSMHVRQYLGGRGRQFELWADGKLQSIWSSPLEVECAVRKLLGITNADALDIEAEIRRRSNLS